MHYADIKRSGKRVELAKRWLDRVLDPDQGVRFRVFGIDTDRLNRAAFGKRAADQQRNAYTRLLRSAVLYLAKTFGPHTEVGTVFHDRSGELERSAYFDWQAILRMGRSSEIRFRNDRIHFVDSDHGREPRFASASQMVQLTDLVLGATRQCMDDTSQAVAKTEVARHFLPLVTRMTDPRRFRNRQGQYAHGGRCTVGFFPSRDLTLEQLGDPYERARSLVYVNRRPALLDRGQLSLDLGSAS